MMEKLLKQIGWSQSYFARRLGVTPKTVGEWVKGEPPAYAMRYLELVVRLVGEKDSSI